jgi:hypothetical protein
MKKFDIKDVFSWSNAKDAKQYIGKACYFADSISTLKDKIDADSVHILEKIINNPETQINCIFHDQVSMFGYGLCLPADKVIDIEKTKKYRPFKSVYEFKKYLGFNFIVNLDIKIEEKITSERYELAIIGFFKNGLVLPIYCDLTMEELFRKFNICIDGKWQPFGVLEND